MRQTSGFALVRNSRSLLEEYGKDPRVRTAQFRRWLARLRAAVPFLDPACYRGISRQPLMPVITVELDDATALARAGIPETLRPGIIRELAHQRRPRERFRELVGEDNPIEDYDEDLLPTHADALEILSLLETPHNYEIISVAREPFEPAPMILGFDVGYWGGDHFSLICDTVVMPRCHPPTTDDFAELANQLRNLNGSLLFSTLSAAERFRSYYISKPWAETESAPGEFCIIRIGLPDIAADASLQVQHLTS